jgi:hypothetical protein
MTTYSIKMEGSEQERQLLETLRDHDGDAVSDFRLLVQKAGRRLGCDFVDCASRPA